MESDIQKTCLRFSLNYWCLWQSEESVSKNPWSFGEILPCNNGLADVSFLPMMQSRRLSPLARAVCSLVWHCLKQWDDMPVVYFSSHGESQYYYEILETIAQHEELSPTRFSLSVHNAIGGLSSCHNESLLPYVCLAGGTEGLFAAFLEAAGILLEAPRVLVVCYEQPLPKIYHPYIASGKTTRALAMVLAKVHDAGHTLELTRRTDQNTGQIDDSGQCFIDSILEGNLSSSCQLEHSLWQWTLDDV